MRKAIIIIIALLAVAAVFAAILIAPAQPKAGPWKLSDGSELSFAGTTHGTNHTMRYGKRFVDYLYPILTPALRKKFKCQVATMPVRGQDVLGLWFWRKDSWAFPGVTAPAGAPMPMYGRQGAFSVVAVDENGMESAAFMYGQGAWSMGSNTLECCALQQFPRRSKTLKVRIYNKYNNNGYLMPQDSRIGSLVGEFTVPNPTPTNYPVWEGKTAPLTIETNGLSVTLAKFEVGAASEGVTAGAMSARMATRAEIMISEEPGPLEWELRSGTVKSATGENHWSSVLPRVLAGPRGAGDFATLGNTSQRVLQFPGTCWLQEPAWKLVLELGRTANFSPEEVWTIKDIRVPGLGWANEVNLKTNINGGEIEFVGVSSKFSAWGSAQGSGSYPPDHEIKVRSPIRIGNAHLKVASIRDDQGRAVGFHASGTTVYQPSGPGPFKPTGPPPNFALEDSFALDIPEGAKSIDVTLAYPKSQFVELLARPTKAGESQ